MAVPTAGPELVTAQPVDELRRFVADLAGQGAFSGVVMVVQDTTPILAVAHGMADRRAGRPNTIDTRFNLASIGKSFTSVAVAQLVERSALSLTKPIGIYLPQFDDPRFRERVTLHQLLTHRSGMGDYFAAPEYAAQRLTLTSVPQYVRLFDQDTLLFEPGTQFRYSNNAYVTVGALIERVAGGSFYDYVQREVFERAGMRNAAYLRLDSVSPAGGAVGYTLRVPRDSLADSSRSWPDGRRENTSFLPGRGGPAGGAYATARDIARFAHALTNGALVSASTTETLTTAKLDTPSGPGLLAREGYGFFDERVRGHRVISNNGGQAGANTQFDIYPAQRIVVVVLSNYDGPAAITVVERARALFLK